MKKHLFLTLLIATTLLGKGQDFYYSQFSTSPMLNNPANAGYYQGMKVRTQYHNHWRGVNKKLQSVNASLEFSTREFVGTGGIGLIMNSEPMLYGIAKNSVGLVGATRIKISKNWIAQVGFSSFLVQKRTDLNSDDYVWSKYLDHRHGVLYRDLAVGSERVYYKNYVDLNLGAVIGYESEYSAARFGFSAFHVTRPEIGMRRGGNKSRLPVRYSIQGDFSFLSRKNIHGFVYYPSYLIEMQGGIINYNFGLNVARRIFYMGLSYHQASFENSYITLVPDMGILIPLNDKKKRLKIGYSYEIPLQVVGATGGVHEITMRFEFDAFQLRRSWKFFPIGNPEVKRKLKFL